MQAVVVEIELCCKCVCVCGYVEREKEVCVTHISMNFNEHVGET